MRIKRSISFIVLAVLGCSGLMGQELTLEQAISIGLENNYEIRILANDAEIAANNNSLGNAGMLPVVDLRASTNFATNETKQEFSSGLVVDKAGVRSNNINAGVFLTWTLFDGFRMFATQQRLQELEAMGSLTARMQIENSLSEIITSYYNIVKQKQLIRGLTDNVEISEERLKIAETRLNVGSGSKLDVLQAKVDRNAQTAMIYREKTVQDELKANLNRLLARSAEIEYEVSDSIPVQFQLNYEELRNKIQNNNTALIYAQRNISLSKQLLREVKAERYPQLDFNASYLFARSENQAGFALLNQNLGLNLGLTASWTIFNGFTLNDRMKNARLEMESAELNLSHVKLQTEQELVIAFKRFNDDKKILELEEENAQMAKEAVDIALERFRIGSSNSIELKEIQRSYEESLIRLAEARYNAKVTETQLMKLNGGLIR